MPTPKLLDYQIVYAPSRLGQEHHEEVLAEAVDLQTARIVRTALKHVRVYNGMCIRQKSTGRWVK